MGRATERTRAKPLRFNRQRMRTALDSPDRLDLPRRLLEGGRAGNDIGHPGRSSRHKACLTGAAPIAIHRPSFRGHRSTPVMGLHYRNLPLWQMFLDNRVHLRDTALVELGSYFLAAGLMFGVVLIWQRRGVYLFRIRRTFAKAAQMRREIFNSVVTLGVFQFAQVIFRVGVMAFGGVVSLERHIPMWQFVLSFPLILIVHETYFYWTHRFMHLPRVFKFMHWEHHKSNAPTPWTSYSFALPEAMIQGSYVAFYVAFFPCTTPTIVFFAIVEILHNVAIHAGIDFFPRFLVTHRIFGWIAGGTHHNLHHATSNSNYGLYFRFWDRMMGTEHPDFVRIYEYVRSPQNDGRAFELISRRAATGVLEPAPAL
jgi:lathosterol oxidase